MKEKKQNRFLFLIIILYPFFFIWQGLDFTDAGYNLVNFQQFFNAPETCKTVNWLTNLIGGSWLRLFGNFGMIGIKIGGILILFLSMLCYFFLYRNYLPENNIFWGLFIGILIYNVTTIMIHYNTLTMLFYAVALFLLMKGIEENQFYIFLSGIILGFNVFIRIPNLVGIGLGLVIIYDWFLYKKTVKSLIINVIFLISGFVLGIFTNIFSMKYIFQNHFEIWMSNMTRLSGVATSTTDTHGFLYLIKLLCIDHLIVFVFLILTMIGFFIIKNFSKKISQKLILSYIIYISGIAVLLLFAKFLEAKIIARLIIWTSAGFAYLVGVYYLRPMEKNKKLQLVSLGALLVFIFTPLGSNNGIRNSRHSIILMTPLIINFMHQLFSNEIKFKSLKIQKFLRFDAKESNVIQNFILVFLISISIICSFRYVYRDDSNRFKLTHPIQSPHLKGIFTTEARAETVNGLLDELQKYINKDDYLLAFEDIPLLHFITETRPFMYNPWPGLFHNPEVFNYKFEKAKNEIGGSPVIVKQKVDSLHPDWPFDNKGNLIEYDIEEPMNKAHINILNQFIENSNYKKVWENFSFEIWIAK